MSITQLNATYLPEEDRVLFRFNTTESFEYRLWLTRAVVKDILVIGAQASVAVLAATHPPEQAKEIAEFKQQLKLDNPQFTTFTPSTKYPMGAEPILVHKANFVLQSQGSLLELTLNKGQLMKIQLTEDMIGQIRLLLQTIADKANWGIGSVPMHSAASADIKDATSAQGQSKESSSKLLH